MENEVPVVRLTLGDSLPEVRRKSTHALPLRRELIEIDLIGVTDPVILEYARDGRTVRFPPGKFLALGITRGQITEVTASPHLESLPLEPALALAAELVARVDRAGWTRAGTAVTATPERIRRELADPEMPDAYRANLAEWVAGDNRITVEVKRHRTAEEARKKARIFGRDSADASDEFIVSVEVYSSRLTNSLLDSPAAAADRRQP